jgi:hypothetical protein
MMQTHLQQVRGFCADELMLNRRDKIDCYITQNERGQTTKLTIDFVCGQNSDFPVEQL